MLMSRRAATVEQEDRQQRLAAEPCLPAGRLLRVAVNSEPTTEGTEHTEKDKETSYGKKRTKVQNEFDILKVSGTGVRSAPVARRERRRRIRIGLSMNTFTEPAREIPVVRVPPEERAKLRQKGAQE